jgi:Lrp/AsnC family transcriptional regulator for asnA, asnC and gidA
LPVSVQNIITKTKGPIGNRLTKKFMKTYNLGMLDKISYQIISELRQDARVSNIDLARKLGVSVATVTKKIRIMIDQDIIVIRGIPNPNMMGYEYQAFIGLSVATKKINRACRELSENSYVHMLTSSFGRFDILLLVLFNDHEKLEHFLKIQLPKIDGLLDFQTYFVSEGRKNDRIHPKIVKESKPVSIDELDYALIRELIPNGNIGYADLAAKLGVSKSTVSRRLNLLFGNEVIKILAIPNPAKQIYSANSYVLASTEYGKIEDICKQLGCYHEVHMVRRLTNDFDILFGAYSDNLDMLYDFLENKISNIDGIRKTETFMCGKYFYFNPEAMLLPSA